MRAFLGLFIAAAVSTVSGFYTFSPRQNPYPVCAQPCIANADLGSCLAGEIACLCKESSFIVATTQCITANCTGSDLQTALQIAQESCAAAGVTLTSSIPGASSTSPGASSATSPSSTSSAKPSSSTSASPNGAASNAVNFLYGAAALGLAGLML
ncbi:hypothetical protein V8E53_002694 [Lactarius tabidus]